MCIHYIFTFFDNKYSADLDITCALLTLALGEHMLKRRRTHKFKRTIINSTATRRRVMLRNLHKKMIWRRRMFTLQQMAEIAESEKMNALTAAAD
jgi:hypothetical protein